MAFLVIRALGGDSGGAKDPEAAVRDLAAAASAEDPAAALAVMNPDEVRAMGELYADIERRAKALGYAPKGKALGGLDFKLEGLRFEVDELSNDVAKVTVAGGTLRYDVSRSKLGRKVNDLIEFEAATEGDPGDPVEVPDETYSGRLEPEDLAHQQDGSGPEQDPFIMVVKRGGGWYVSPLYTAAEYVTQVNGLPAGAFDDIEAGEATADSPQAAVKNLADALGRVDSDRAIDQLSGTELIVLRSYRKSIADLLAQSLDDSGVENPRADLAEVDVSTDELEGGLVKATITTVEGTARWTDEDGEQQAAFAWDGKCLTVTRQGEDDNVDCITADTRRYGITDAFLVLEDEGGGWQVSPVATLLRYAEEMLPKLDDNLLSRFFGAPQLVEPIGPAEIGTPLTAKLNDAGFAVYDVAVKQGEGFSLDARSEDDEESFAYLVDEDGREITSSSVLEPEVDATWKLIVVRDPYEEATVEVSLIPVLERPLTTGKTARGAIAQPGQIVDYTFDAEAGDDVTVEFDNDDLDATLLDPTGDFVEPSSTGSYVLPDNGEYRVRVTGDTTGPGATGEYRLTVAPTIVFVLGNGTTNVATGTIDTPETFLTIDLEVRGGSEAVATISATNAAMDLTLVVVDPDGTRTPYNKRRAGGTESVRLRPAVTTVYDIEVNAVGGLGDVQIEAKNG
ncbi:MAG: PPC domain-containing protein [Acidimicrobiales bacterium]